MTEPIDEADERGADHPVLEAALGRLEELGSRPVGEHVAVFEQVHDELRRALDPSH